MMMVQQPQSSSRSHAHSQPPHPRPLSRSSLHQKAEATHPYKTDTTHPYKTETMYHHKAETTIFSSAIKALSQCKVPTDTEDVLRRKAIQIAKWVKASNSLIVLTGTGVAPPGSTENDTIIKPMPTLTHMALLKLHTEGKLKYIVTQTTDGLHHTSGIDPSYISELHGNIYTENCVICGKVYLREYTVELKSRNKSSSSHRTGRACLKCGGGLQDNLVKQQAPLPLAPLARGLQEAETADMCIVLGSALLEESAANIATKVAQRGKKLVICNNFASSLDEIAAVRVNAKSDTLMSAIMHELRYVIPAWRLRRRVSFMQKGSVGNMYNFEVQGRDYDHVYASILKKVVVKSINGDAANALELVNEPFVLSRSEPVTAMHVELVFIGSYNEPSYELEVQLLPTQDIMLDLFYNPYKHVWEHATAQQTAE